MCVLHVYLCMRRHAIDKQREGERERARERVRERKSLCERVSNREREGERERARARKSSCMAYLHTHRYTNSTHI